jgi:hypothetical protein
VIYFTKKIENLVRCDVLFNSTHLLEFLGCYIVVWNSYGLTIIRYNKASFGSTLVPDSFVNGYMIKSDSL